jgi:hypothetical protein
MAFREKIVSLKKATWDYVEARRMASERGMKLPSNVLHDEHLHNGDWERIKDIYPAWAREILVYPRIGRKMAKGRDVLDSLEDHLGRRWMLPSEYVRKANEHGEVYGVPDAGLLVEPGQLEESNWRVIVHPNSMTILHNVVSLDAMGGLMNEITGLPHRVPSGQRIPPGLMRRLFRNEGAGVRPIIRGVFGLFADARPDIHAGDGWPLLYQDQRDDIRMPRFRGFGVSGVSLDEARFTVEKKDGRLIVEGTRDMLDAALKILESLKRGG